MDFFACEGVVAVDGDLGVIDGYYARKELAGSCWQFQVFAHFKLNGAGELSAGHGLDQTFLLLTDELLREQNRVARLGTFDPAELSQDVKAAIQAHGVSVDTFRTADAAGRIEVFCSIRGQGSEVFAFLKTVAEQREHWIVPEISVARTGEGDTVTAELRITHEEIVGIGR